MTPGTDHILLNAIGTLTTNVAPEVSTAFGQGQLGLISALLYFAALDYEQAADIRARENREMRALFADAAEAPIGVTAEMQEALTDAAASVDADLRISTLNEANQRLASLLIALHEHLETRNDETARALEARVWRLLRASADARALTLPELG